MKLPSRLVVLFLSAALPLSLFFFSRQSQISSPNNNVPQGTFVEQKKKSVQERYRYYEERDRFEFDQLKDPRTGKIPRNIRQLELAFAKRQPVRPESDNPLIGNVYTALGPNNLGGRTRAIAYDKVTPTIMLAGGVSSGIFRTVTSGTTWTNVTTAGDIHNVTSIVQDPRAGFETTWYYATGEGSGNSASETGGTYYGHGVWKSVDNGLTWSRLSAFNMGTLETIDRHDYVSKIVVDPTNGNVYAATLNRIARSIDGGATWTSPVLGKVGSFSTSEFTDIVVTSAGRFYAAFSGTAGNSTASGTPASTDLDGVWTSTTGATGSWTKIAGTGAATTPTGWNAASAYGRVVLALAPSNEDILYILYNNFFSSSCAGTPGVEADFFKWTQSITSGVDRTANLPDEAGCLDGNDPFAIQGGYDLVVAVKPDDENFVVIGGTNAYRSTDGFATTGFTTRIGGYASAGGYAKYAIHHPDIHALTFHPTASTTMVCGDDGGIQRTSDITAGTVVWTSLNNDYVTYQYYHIALDPTVASLVAIGGTQDNGTTHTTGGSTSHTEVFSGDGVSVGISSSNTWHYVGYQNGNILRRDPADPPGFATDIKPTGSGSGIFITYFYLNPDNTEHLYFADLTTLFRTTSASTVTSGTWTVMTGVSSTVVGSIRVMATSRQTYTAAHKLYIGTASGKIYRLGDPAGTSAATAPVDITGGTMPAANVSGIAVDLSDDKKVMVTFSSYGVTSIWYTDDASVATPTWTAVEGTLTLPSVRACLIVSRNGFPTEYYVGTSVGLYSTASLTGGTTTWTQEGPGTIKLAVVRSFGYRYTDNRMLVGTHGNGMFYADVPNPLPVQLASFTARVVNSNSVRLDWRTLSEINNYGFFVERKREGEAAFIEVPNSFMPGHGTTNEPHDYSFIDANVPSGRWSYRLRQVDLDNTIHYSEPVNVSVLTSVAENETPNAFALHQNYPNPFNPSTTIRFDLPKESHVKLSVFNSVGQLVASLVNERRQAGVHRATFTAQNLASGMYLYKLETKGFVQTRKLLLVR